MMNLLIRSTGTTSEALADGSAGLGVAAAATARPDGDGVGSFGVA
jgi:hypothetical protein